MTTEAQIDANRANAQKSTGPKTPEGKAVVAQNAIKHGLRARYAVIAGEDTDDYELLRDQLDAEMAPVGLVESRLVERIAGLFWRLQRAERLHNGTFDVLHAQCVAEPRSKLWRPAPDPEAPDPLVGLTVVNDFSQTRVMERLLVCEQRLEKSLYRAMAELRQVQDRRQARAAVPSAGPRGAVRATHPTDRSRAEEDRLRRRSGRGREVPPLDFTLDNLLAKIIAVEGKRAGTMANTPPGKPCKTKPISEGVSSEAVGAGSCAWPSGGRPPGAAPTHVTLQTLGGTPTAQGQSCQTNPNCGSPRGTGTLPVSQDHGQDGDPKGDSSRLGTPAHATTSAVFCQTKPIGSLGERQVLCSPEVTKDSPQGGTGRAKPQEAGYRPVHCVGRPAVRS